MALKYVVLSLFFLVPLLCQAGTVYIMPTKLFYSTKDLFKMGVRLVEAELEDAKQTLQKAGGAPEALSKIAESENSIKEVYETCDEMKGDNIDYPPHVENPSKKWHPFFHAIKFGERLKGVLQKATTQTGMNKDVQVKLNKAIEDAENAGRDLVGVVFYNDKWSVSEDYLPSEPYSHAKNQLHMAMRLVQLEFKKAKSLLPSGNISSIYTQLEAVGRLIDELVEHIPTMNYHDIPKYDRNKDNPGKTLYSNSYAHSAGYKIHSDVKAILKELEKSSVQAQISNHTNLAKQLQMVANDADNVTSSFGNLTQYDWDQYSSSVKRA